MTTNQDHREAWAVSGGDELYELLFDRWISYGHAGVKEKARRLLRTGSVDVDVESGLADVSVFSARKIEHRVLLEVNGFTNRVWSLLAADIAASPRATAMLYAGRLDPDLLTFGGASLAQHQLVPRGYDVRFECSCKRGRRYSYCEHALAALVRLIDPLDDLRLVVWRAGDPVDLERQVRALRRRDDPGIGANRSWVRARNGSGVAYPFPGEPPADEG